VDWIHLAQNTVVGSCEHGNEPSLWVSWLAERLSGFQEGLYSMEVVILNRESGVRYKRRTHVIKFILEKMGMHVSDAYTTISSDYFANRNVRLFIHFSRPNLPIHHP
jgi:hypothetical protein